jgi:tetratricopeptide (TPR) repeat protein
MESNQEQANEFAQQGTAFHSQKKYEQAIEAYEKAIALFPPYRAYKFIIGEMLFELRRVEEAAQAFRETLEFTPDHEQAWNDLGQCLLLLGRHEQALQAFECAIEIKPDYVEALYNGAMAHARLQHPAKAKAYLAKVLTLRPDWEPYARENALLKEYLP